MNLDNMNFGRKFRKLRKQNGLSQRELGKRLGYVNNSYVANIEKGTFIPSEKKLKKIAKTLNVPYSEIKDLLIEAKLEELGVKEPELQALIREIPKMPRNGKKRIIEAYLKIKGRFVKK